MSRISSTIALVLAAVVVCPGSAVGEDEDGARTRRAAASLVDVASAATAEQRFLHLAVERLGFGPRDVDASARHLGQVDRDLPVALFIARTSGRSVEHVARLRSGGRPWRSAFQETGTPYDALFTGLDRDPGRPHGAAWSRWRAAPRTVRLSDEEISGLAALQIAREITGRPALELARAVTPADLFRIVLDDTRRWPNGPSRRPSDDGGEGDRGRDDDGERDRGRDRDRDGDRGRNRDRDGRGRSDHDDDGRRHEDSPRDPDGRDRDDDDNDRDERSDDLQLTICHIPPGNPAARHTIRIGESAWPAHRRHGDHRGSCR